MYGRPSKIGKVNPLDSRKVANEKKAQAKTVKSVKSVAKDTNKTRRKNTLLPLKNKIKAKSIKRLHNKDTK